MAACPLTRRYAGACPASVCGEAEVRLPSLGLAVAFNSRVRAPDEWFLDDSDDLGRVVAAIRSVGGFSDPVVAAAALSVRVARAQGFAEGNKRTGLLLARWVLDRNGVDGSELIPPDDRRFAGLLVKAAAGRDVEAEAVSLLLSRR